jgi:hypothetical protein
MTTPAGNPLDAVAGLMLERQRYEAWIAQLEAKRAITPPHVFERVRADYEARLKDVIAQLSGRTTELKDTIAALTTRLAALQKEESKLRDERYEAELRAAVGEYTPEQWKDLVATSDAELARRAADRANVSSELARLQQILSMSGSRAASGELPPLPANALDGSDASGSTSAPITAVPGAPGTREPGRPGPNFDELAFLKSVIDPRAEAAAASQAPASPGAPTPGAPPPASDAGSSSAPRPRPGAAALSTPQEQKPVVERPPEPEVPEFLKDVPVDNVKTLRCAECGSMNYPTEWYCERCGAELTSM